jgi:hypothetical protein
MVVKLAQQQLHRHAGGAKAQVHLHHDRHNLVPERHLRQLLNKRAPYRKVWYPDLCIYILCFPVLEFSIVICMAKIACTRMVIFQMC